MAHYYFFHTVKNYLRGHETEMSRKIEEILKEIFGNFMKIEKIIGILQKSYENCGKIILIAIKIIQIYIVKIDR